MTLEGAIDIGCATQLKMQLLEALNAGAEVVLSLAQVTYLDATALQLLWAAHRQAALAGTAFTLREPLPEPLRSTVAEAGFPSFLVSAAGS